MVEGTKKKRVWCFILFTFFTGFLIFIGMYLQYKMNVLEVPIAKKIKTGIIDGIFGSIKKKEGVDENSETNEDESDENVKAIVSAVKSLQRSVVMTTVIPVKKTVERYHGKNDLDLDNKIDILKKKISDIDKIDEPTSKNNKISSYPKLSVKETPDLMKKHSNVLVQQPVIKTGEFKKRFPQAIIAGVKKGGTRALLSFLGKHPSIRSGGKEMHFFDKNERYEKGLSFYLNQMPQSFANEMTIEKTPGYFVKPYVPQRIYNFNRKVKLIFILRDPVQRAISDFTQAISKEGKEGKRFEDLVFKKSNPNQVDQKNSKISIGLYIKHVKNWLQYFPLKQMYFVNGDEFIQNPVKEIKNVQKFLNLPVLIDRESFHYNKTKGFYCIIVKRKNGGDVTSDCLGSSKGRKHPSIKESTIEKLTEFFKPYNRKLYNLIKKDFHWPT